jgi:hypothetical protein
MQEPDGTRKLTLRSIRHQVATQTGRVIAQYVLDYEAYGNILRREPEKDSGTLDTMICGGVEPLSILLA